MTRTGQAAIDYARGRVGPNAMPASGYCLQFVRECFAVGSYYGSAIAAWNNAERKHPGDRNPPPAVPLYFATPSQYDHVVFKGDTGEIITTFNADVRRYTASSTSAVIDAICRDFSGTYQGWAEDINRVTVWTPTPPEEDMPSAQEVAEAVWAFALQRANGPVADAGTYLVDTRILLGDPAAPLVRVADAVWAVQVDRPNGPPVDAGTYLVDTRAIVGPVDRGPVPIADQVWAADIDRPGVQTTDAGSYITGTAVATGAAEPESVGRGHHHHEPRAVDLDDSTIERIAVAVAALLARTDRDHH